MEELGSDIRFLGEACDHTSAQTFPRCAGGGLPWQERGS